MPTDLQAADILAEVDAIFDEHWQTIAPAIAPAIATPSAYPIVSAAPTPPEPECTPPAMGPCEPHRGSSLTARNSQPFEITAGLVLATIPVAFVLCVLLLLAQYP